MKTAEYIKNRVKKMHFSLIDPDPAKINNLEKMVKNLEKAGSDAIMVGGSTNIDNHYLDDVVKKIKSSCKLPVILFPGALTGVSKYADAIFFMTLMNSSEPKYITGLQSAGAIIIKEMKIETLPMGYIIFEPGGRVGKVGKAELIKMNETDKAIGYALAAQYFGMNFVYLEAGSGAEKPISPEIIAAVKKNIDITLIVGGGIRSGEDARKAVEAGADIIVTGTVIENDFSKVKEIINAVKK